MGNELPQTEARERERIIRKVKAIVMDIVKKDIIFLNENDFKDGETYEELNEIKLTQFDLSQHQINSAWFIEYSDGYGRIILKNKSHESAGQYAHLIYIK